VVASGISAPVAEGILAPGEADRVGPPATAVDAEADDAARTLAAKERIDLKDVVGTGQGGRIRVEDVQRTAAVRQEKRRLGLK
jgi:pyruvate/2-oxoglutarate dehydrogenase complex dihydrolipoamide acyltransferase (E2) component